MNQHPIDDLFTRHLKNHHVQPERASWQEMQRRMKNRRTRLFGWWYAAAAGIAITSLAAWWTWSNYGKLQPASHAVLVYQSTRNPRLAKAPIPSKAPAGKGLLLVYEQSSIRPIKPKANRKVTVAKKKRMEMKQELIAVVQPTLLDETHSVPPIPAKIESLPLKQPERTLVVQIAEPVLIAAHIPIESVSERYPMTEEEQPRKKRFRVGRLLRQVSNLKVGRVIEWEDVRIQPRVFLARASEKIVNSYEDLRATTFKKHLEHE